MLKTLENLPIDLVLRLNTKLDKNYSSELIYKFTGVKSLIFVTWML